MSVELPTGTAELIKRAYREDLGDAGDITSTATIPSHHMSCASFVARSGGCIAGVRVIEACLRYIDRTIDVIASVDDGAIVTANTPILQATGPTRSLLTAERVALNVVSHLSGIATATQAFVDAVAGTGTAIADTRKTTPGLRSLEKYAVACGGGTNHRMGLYDAVMLKDNHLVAAESIPQAVAAARASVGKDVVLEVEVDTLDQLAIVLTTDADVVLLDNMDPETLTRAVAMVGGAMRTEASGGITLDTVRTVAETGVDVISVGWLTHSAPSLDIALDLESVST